MGRLHVTQIEKRLGETVLPLVDVDDLQKYKQADAEKTAKSRGLAAFAAMHVAGVNAEEAASAITDEPGDNGIDLALALPAQRRIVIVQSKWAEDSGGSASKDDMLKLRAGLDDLVSCKWNKFGPKLAALKDDLEDLLYDPKVQIDIVFAHLGRAEIADEVQEVIDDYLRDMNDPSETATFTYLNQGRLHRLLVAETTTAKIDLEVDVSDWGTLDTGPQAFYGHVSGSDIADWYHTYGDSLLVQNVRMHLSDSEVNEGLLQTLRDEPSSFWYYNNGITMLCEKIVKAPAGGADRRVSRFGLTGVSIVNGAQTAGTISRFSQQGGDLSSVQVLVRFISLENAAPGFASNVTKGTNTQNRIGGREFVSMDPEQGRLRDEFAVAGLTYVFRTGEASPPPQTGCDLDDATVALACAHSAQLATQAKREISRLWDDISKAPYKLLFNSSTTYLHVWRTVQALRMVEEELRNARRELVGRDQLIATHGNRALLNLLFQQVSLNGLDDPDRDWDVALTKIRSRFSPTLHSMIEIVNSDFPGYPASTFKNASKVTAIGKAVLADVSANASNSL